MNITCSVHAQNLCKIASVLRSVFANNLNWCLIGKLSYELSMQVVRV